MYKTQNQQAPDLKACGQRAAATHEDGGKDTLASKRLLVDQSADSQSGVKGDSVVDPECYCCNAVERGYECCSHV